MIIAVSVDARLWKALGRALNLDGVAAGTGVIAFSEYETQSHVK
jgi:hypothetical protein